MKLTILGGGGFRVPQVYEAVATSATGLEVDEVVLHDVDAARLETMTRVITAMPAHERGRPSARATTDLRDALGGADFVFCAIRVGGAKGRTVDERVALDLGLLGQETVGPGGLAYALRTIPVMHEVARTITDVAPEAWVINFTNPAGIVTQAMRGVLGDRVAGICDTPIGLVKRVAGILEVPLAELDYDYVGLNHMGWLRSVTHQGRNLLPGLMADEALLDRVEEARLIGMDWVRQMGSLPNEYLYYYFHTDKAVATLSGGQTRGEFLVEQQDAFYTEASCCTSPLETWRAAMARREATYMAESRQEERREEDLAGGGYQEVALRLMTAIALDKPERMILDVGNDARSMLPQLPDGTVVEVPCLVDGGGVHPQPVAPLTLGQLGMMARLRASEECIMQAALTGDRGAAWEGFSTHPLVDSPRLGAKLLEGYEQGHPEIAALFG